MCTVTVIPGATDADRASRSPFIRLLCNRDEQRSRPPSCSPVRRRLGDHSAIMPVDPPSRGTWIGANDAGLVACLLNANPPGTAGITHKGPPRASRGRIVPALLAAATIEGALDLADAIDVTQFPPFRVLVLNAALFLIASSDGASLKCSQPAPLQSPILLTSSGLGDHLVEHPRRVLFDRMLSSTPNPLVAQDRFHQHRWHDMPHLSVRMSRPDARTVCRCAVDLFPNSVALSHSNLNDRLVAGSPTTRLELLLRRSKVAA
jgi:hypothetical protein